jgi:DNA-binding transcriptional regulator YiaG
MSATPGIARLDWAPLRVMRRRLDVSQTRAGAWIGVSGSLVSKWEGGSRQPSALQLVRLATTLGVPMYALFNAIEKKP